MENLLVNGRGPRAGRLALNTAHGSGVESPAG